MRLLSIAGAVLFLALGVQPLVAAQVQLPQTTRATLDNGLTVIVMPMQRLPLVDFRLVVRSGAVDDPAGKEGLARLTADLMPQGAGKRGAQEVAEAIDFVGGTLSSSAGTEQLVVSCEVLTKDVDIGLELFRDVIVSPTFPAEEFERKKSEALGAIASSKDDPASVASVEMLPFLMGDSPLAHAAMGWERSVSTLTRDDVTAFHRRHVVPGNAILAVVGDVDPQAVMRDIEKAFAGWQAGSGPQAIGYQPFESGGRAVRIVNKPEVTQTQVRMACAAVARNHPDYYALRVANVILGAGFTSRLIDEIRVNQGLTYSISSGFSHYRNAGAFSVSTFTKNEQVRKIIDETLAVISRLVDEGPTAEEVTKGKRYITGLFPLGLQAPDQLAAQLVDIEFHGLDDDYIEAFAGKIDAVTMDDVRRVLAEHFCVDDLKILVVSNPETARAALEGLGPIEVTEIQ